MNVKVNEFSEENMIHKPSTVNSLRSEDGLIMRFVLDGSEAKFVYRGRNYSNLDSAVVSARLLWG
jgi:hypothetical protein